MSGVRRAQALKVVPGGLAPSVTQFCGHCGEADDDPAPANGRVCGSCGLGIMLEAPSDVAPTTNDAFLVVDPGLRVAGLSREAERLLGVSEPDAVNRYLSDFLTAADMTETTARRFFSLLLSAASGSTEPAKVAVRPVDVFGVRFWAKLGNCGPPSAALIVLTSDV